MATILVVDDVPVNREFLGTLLGYRGSAMITRLAVALTVAWAVLAPMASAQLAYVGSATIGDHIIPAAAKAFTAKTGVQFGSVETQGSGKGLEMVLSGKAHLAGVSRPLTLAEKQRPLYYRIIGYDAISVSVHPDNPVSSLTKQQLKAIYTGQISNWKEVGGPDAAIVCITLVWGAGRALMIEFREHVMDGVPYRSDRKEFDLQSDAATALLSESYGITALSVAYTHPGIKAVAIEGFLPTLEHIRSGAYLLSRPLLLVSQAHPTSEVKQFIDFMVSPEGQASVAHAFVPIR